MTNDPNPQGFVNLDNTKGRPEGVYGSVIEQIQKDKVCPFCTEHLTKYHRNPIDFETDHWILTSNMYPYEGARVHILIIHKEHITDESEMSDEAWMDLRKVIRKAHELYKLPGKTLLLRSGDTRFTGASVTHLHAQIISPDPDDPHYKPVLARVG